ncbi:MAG: hypothetical protein ACUZ8N_08255 [Candidatus Scalindua sp.]
MNNEQKLYYHKIYQKNRLLEEFKQVCGIEKRLVSFNILNFHNRKFNWYVVDNNRWKFDEQIIQNINDCMDSEQLKDERKSFYEKLKKLNIEELVDSIKYFENGERKDGNSSKEEMEDFHFHLLNLYQYYPHEEDDGIDGVVYRNFKNKRERLLYTKGELLTDLEKSFRIYPWINMTFIYKSYEEIQSLSAQEQQSNGAEKDIEYTTEETFESKKHEIAGRTKNKKKVESGDELAKKIYFHYMVPLIVGYSHPDPAKGGLFDGGKFQDGEKEYLLKAETIRELVNKYKYILCFPVYDTFINKSLYGNFYGNITIPFEFKHDRDVFLKKHKRKIEENLFLLIR